MFYHDRFSPRPPSVNKPIINPTPNIPKIGLVKLYAPVKQGPKYFWKEYSWNILRNMIFHKMEYSRKIAQYDNVEFFWNMEYSWNIAEKYYNKQNFPFFGI